MDSKKKYEPLLEGEYIQDEEPTLSDSSFSVDVHLKPKQGASKFFLHLKLLIHKNILLFWRSKKVTLFQFLTPIISIFVLFLLQILFTDIGDFSNEDPAQNYLKPLPLCYGKD